MLRFAVAVPWLVASDVCRIIGFAISGTKLQPTRYVL